MNCRGGSPPAFHVFFAIHGATKVSFLKRDTHGPILGFFNEAKFLFFLSPGFEKAMSIRLIARDLYRLQQEVEELEKALAAAPAETQAALRDQLRKTRAERDRMQRILEGTKAPPPYRQPR